MEFYKEKNHKKSVISTIITLSFLLIGIALFIVGYYNEMLSWVKDCGVVIICLSVPAVVFIVYLLINGKVKRM